jgi:hypothetical protein
MAEPKTMKWRLIFFGAVVLAAFAGAGTWWAKSVLRDSSVAYEQAIARSEKEFVIRLDTWLARPDDPRDSFDLQFFLSSAVLEKIADTVEGQTIQFGNGQGLTIRTLRFELRTGFPLVRLSGEYRGGNRSASFGGEIAAVLELAGEGDTYVLRIRPLSVRPALGIGALRVAMRGLLGDVSQKIARDYADSWPGIELPVQTLIPVKIPPFATDVVIKIGGKEGDSWIGTMFGFPKLGADLKIVYEGLVFTKQGVHLFANLRKADKNAPRNYAVSKEWQALSQAQKLDAIGFGDRDLGARVSKRVFAFAVARLAEMPAADRVITIQGQERSGNIVTGNAGPIHYDIWLENPPLAKGVMQVDRMTAEVSDDPREIIRYRAEGNVQIQGQLGARVGFGKPKDSKNLQDKDPIPVVFSPTAVAVAGRFVLTMDGDLPIIAIMIDPTEEIEPRVGFKLPMIGYIAIRPKFRFPETRMTRIKLPPAFETGGAVRIGEQSTPYRIRIRGMECTGERTYLTLLADVALELGGN